MQLYIFDIEFYSTFVAVLDEPTPYTGAKLTKKYFIDLTLSAKMRCKCANLRTFNS